MKKLIKQLPDKINMIKKLNKIEELIINSGINNNADVRANNIEVLNIINELKDGVNKLSTGSIFAVVDYDGDLVNLWSNEPDANNHAKELNLKHGDDLFTVHEEPVF